MDVDVAYQYLSFFMDDDAELERLKLEYQAGTLGTVEMKDKCVQVLQEVVADVQERRRAITEADIELYMTPKEVDVKFG